MNLLTFPIRLQLITYNFQLLFSLFGVFFSSFYYYCDDTRLLNIAKLEPPVSILHFIMWEAGTSSLLALLFHDDWNLEVYEYLNGSGKIERKNRVKWAVNLAEKGCSPITTATTPLFLTCLNIFCCISRSIVLLHWGTLL